MVFEKACDDCWRVHTKASIQKGLKLAGNKFVITVTTATQHASSRDVALSCHVNMYILRIWVRSCHVVRGDQETTYFPALTRGGYCDRASFSLCSFQMSLSEQKCISWGWCADCRSDASFDRTLTCKLTQQRNTFPFSAQRGRFLNPASLCEHIASLILSIHSSDWRVKRCNVLPFSTTQLPAKHPQRSSHIKNCFQSGTTKTYIQLPLSPLEYHNSTHSFVHSFVRFLK